MDPLNKIEIFWAKIVLCKEESVRYLENFHVGFVELNDFLSLHLSPSLTNQMECFFFKITYLLLSCEIFFKHFL